MLFRKIFQPKKKNDANIPRAIFPQSYLLQIDRNKKGFLKEVGGLEEYVGPF
jgi:hypothetical protein